MANQSKDVQEPEICNSCNGRGRWQEQQDQQDGSIELVWMYCNDCDGTGVINQDDDTFNLSGEDDDL